LLLILGVCLYFISLSLWIFFSLSVTTFKTLMYQVSVSGSTVPATTLLHPRVKQALAYLDCYLEDELLRYRRAKSGSQVAPSSARAMRPDDRAKATVELTQFMPIDALPKPASDESLKSENLTDEVLRSEAAMPLASDVLAGLAVIPEDGEASEEAYSLDDLMNNSGMEMLGDRYASPDDYLESSEELLRSLAQEEANVEHERSSLESLLTPFGIGSMMLMLMGSGMFGYLVMNPSTFTALGSGLSRMVSGFRGGSSAPAAPVVAAAPAQGGGEVPKESSEFMDLSLKSLVVMGTQGKGTAALRLPAAIAPKTNVPGAPGSIVNAQPGIMPTVIVPGQPIGAAGNSAPAGTAIVGGGTPQGAAPSAAPSNVAAQPAAKPKPSLYRPAQPQKTYQRSTAPQPVRTVELPPAPSTPTSIPPVETVPVPATGGYRVEIPYTGDTDLERAQKSDSGAYFKNGENGAVIQMGETYSSREAAEAKVQQLKQQGFDGVEVQK
jgi:hypothetical protein